MINSNISLITFKKYDHDTQNYTRYHEVEQMPLSTFMSYLDNLSQLMEVHWSIDFLNPDFTTATVYVKC